MVQVNIPMDESVKDQAEAVFREMGLNFSSAIHLFVMQSILEGALPFQVTSNVTEKLSDFQILDQSIQEKKEGKLITKTMEELWALESLNLLN